MAEHEPIRIAARVRAGEHPQPAVIELLIGELDQGGVPAAVMPAQRALVVQAHGAEGQNTFQIANRQFVVIDPVVLGLDFIEEIRWR